MKSFKILIAGLLFLGACRAVSTSDQPKLEETRWQLIAMDKKPVDFGDKAFLTFNDKDRKIAGKTVCNSIFADYELTGGKISFGAIGSTKIYCDGQMDKENQLITDLQKVKKFEIKYGLLYLYGSDDLLLTYKKVAAPAQ